MPGKRKSESVLETPFSERDLRRLVKVALNAAFEAGRVQTKYFRRKFRISEKEGAGLVTEVDLRSEELILKTLRKAFPEIPVIGEESGASPDVREFAPVWHVDPLDGTTNFAHGFPFYGVSIGLAIGDLPIVGVIHAPSLKETWFAYRGGGAFWNRQRIRVSVREEFRECLLATGFAYTKGAPLKLAVERFRHVSQRSRAVRRPGAAAIDLAYLAMGVYDGFWERDLKSWDLCAGILLVEEAGGLITNFTGGPFAFAEKEVLGSNGLIHRNMINVLKAGLESFEKE